MRYIDNKSCVILLTDSLVAVITLKNLITVSKIALNNSKVFLAIQLVGLDSLASIRIIDLGLIFYTTNIVP